MLLLDPYLLFLFSFLLPLFVYYIFRFRCLFLSMFVLYILSWVFPSWKRLSSDFIPVLYFFNLLHDFSNSWFAVSKLFKHVLCITSLRTISWITSLTWMGSEVKTSWKQPRKNKVGAIRHFLRSDVNSVQKTDGEGTGLKDVAWVPWSFGGCNVVQWHDAMACNGLEYFRFILLRYASTWRSNSCDSHNFFWILMTLCIQPGLIRMYWACFLAGLWKLISEWWYMGQPVLVDKSVYAW